MRYSKKVNVSQRKKETTKKKQNKTNKTRRTILNITKFPEQAASPLLSIKEVAPSVPSIL